VSALPQPWPLSPEAYNPSIPPTSLLSLFAANSAPFSSNNLRTTPFTDSKSLTNRPGIYPAENALASSLHFFSLPEMNSNMDIDWAALNTTTLNEMLAYMEANPYPSLDAVEVPQTNDDSISGFTDYSAMLDDAVAANELVDKEPLQIIDEDR
jgi:hypothetical protein